MAESFRHGAVDVIRASDRLDAAHVETLQPLVDAALKHGQPMLVIDLSQVPLIDSNGLDFLLDTRDRCLHRGGECKLAGAGALCRDILHVSGVDEELELEADMVTAAGSFAR